MSDIWSSCELERQPATGSPNFATRRSVNGRGRSWATRTGRAPRRTVTTLPGGTSKTRRPSQHSTAAEACGSTVIGQRRGRRGDQGPAEQRVGARSAPAAAPPPRARRPGRRPRTRTRSSRSGWRRRRRRSRSGTAADRPRRPAPRASARGRPSPRSPRSAPTTAATTSPSRSTVTSTVSRSSTVYSPPPRGARPASRSPNSASARKPTLPRLMPSSGTWAGRASSAARSSVPSPPRAKTISAPRRRRARLTGTTPGRSRSSASSAITRTVKPAPIRSPATVRACSVLSRRPVWVTSRAGGHGLTTGDPLRPSHAREPRPVIHRRRAAAQPEEELDIARRAGQRARDHPGDAQAQLGGGRRHVRAPRRPAERGRARRPPGRPCSLPTSNCGFTIGTRSPSSAVQAASAGSTSRSEMNDRSATVRSTGPPIVLRRQRPHVGALEHTSPGNHCAAATPAARTPRRPRPPGRAAPQQHVGEAAGGGASVQAAPPLDRPRRTRPARRPACAPPRDTNSSPAASTTRTGSAGSTIAAGLPARVPRTSTRPAATSSAACSRERARPRRTSSVSSRLRRAMPLRRRRWSRASPAARGARRSAARSAATGGSSSTATSASSAASTRGWPVPNVAPGPVIGSTARPVSRVGLRLGHRCAFVALLPLAAFVALLARVDFEPWQPLVTLCPWRRWSI